MVAEKYVSFYFMIKTETEFFLYIHVESLETENYFLMRWAKLLAKTSLAMRTRHKNITKIPKIFHK